MAFAVPLPSGDAGIGFDDLQFSSTLRRVIVPAGRTGRVDLVNPDDSGVTTIAGFTATDGYQSGSYSDGPTSAVEVRGLLAVIDKTASALVIADPATAQITSSVPLAFAPDYVRRVTSTNELWLTAPTQGQIEVFTLSQQDPPVATNRASIPIDLGPEALVIDETRGRAYTNSFTGQTFAVDLKTRAVVETWTNGCTVSLGIALDEARGFAVIACSEGKLVVLDVAHAGAQLSELTVGNGLDTISYSPTLGHVYAAAGAGATLSIAGLAADGSLTLLKDVATAAGARCVAADDRAHAWVCDPDRGQLLRVADPFPAQAQ
ncbi:MAG: YncE family protein [Polyangiaceae bacterium]